MKDVIYLNVKLVKDIVSTVFENPLGKFRNVKLRGISSGLLLPLSNLVLC